MQVRLTNADKAQCGDWRAVFSLRGAVGGIGKPSSARAKIGTGRPNTTPGDMQ
jgi:hypothetical protein